MNEATPPEKPLSAKKLAANRRNGALGRGPKTEPGKKNSSPNALKHGILARAPVIQAGEAKEDLYEYDTFLAAVLADRDAQGPLEIALATEIANVLWRLRRVQRCEIGAIRAQADTLTFDETLRERRDHHDAVQFNMELNVTSAGLEQLLGELEEFLGRLSDAADPAVATDWITWCETYGIFPDAVRKLRASQTDAQPAGILRELMVQAMTTLRQDKAEADQRRHLALEAKREYVMLPSIEDQNKFLRYETTLRRHLDRLLQRLDRIQAARRSLAAGPPAGSIMPLPRRQEMR